MTLLEDVRLCSDWIDPVGFELRTGLALRIVECARLETLYLPHWKTYNELMRLPRRFDAALREVSMVLGMASAGQLVNFFQRFTNLTRIEVYLYEHETRFIELLVGLQHLPNVEVLIATVSQHKLINTNERARLARNVFRVLPLMQMRSISVNMQIAQVKCSSFSLGPIFRSNSGIRGRGTVEEHQPPEEHCLPVMCALEVGVESGQCSRHASSTYYVRKKLFRWFNRLATMQIVRYWNTAKPELNVELFVERNGSRPELWPDII